MCQETVTQWLVYFSWYLHKPSLLRVFPHIARTFQVKKTAFAIYKDSIAKFLSAKMKKASSKTENETV